MIRWQSPSGPFCSVMSKARRQTGPETQPVALLYQEAAAAQRRPLLKSLTALVRSQSQFVLVSIGGIVVSIVCSRRVFPLRRCNACIVGPLLGTPELLQGMLHGQELTGTASCPHRLPQGPALLPPPGLTTELWNLQEMTLEILSRKSRRGNFQGLVGNCQGGSLE